jgi:hypothetical protein
MVVRAWVWGFIMTESRAYEEIVNFFVAGPSSELVATIQPSEATRQHVGDLVTREKTTGLTAEETSELDHYLHVEHLMRLARARARTHLKP